MIIKSFAAPTIAAALKKIREEMGSDAVVLKTSICPEEEAYKTGHRVEVTVCIDPKAIKPSKTKKNAGVEKTTEQGGSNDLEMNSVPWPAMKESDMPALARIEKTLSHILTCHRSQEFFNSIDSRVKPVFLNLLDADIPVEIAHRIARETANIVCENENVEQAAYEILKAELATVSAADIVIEPGMRVIFLGPSGVGKSSVMGKVAAQLCAEFRQKVKLASLDSMKVSAFEEVAGYAELLDLPVELIDEMKREHCDDSILLVDTPAICHDRQRQIELCEKIKSFDPNLLFLVFSTCARSDDLIDSINIFESFAPTHLVASHLDETDRWGGILTMAEYLDIHLAFINDTPGGIGRLKIPDPDEIARHLLKMELHRNDE